jgi:hypothetical protein
MACVSNVYIDCCLEGLVTYNHNFADMSSWFSTSPVWMRVFLQAANPYAAVHLTNGALLALYTRDWFVVFTLNAMFEVFEYIGGHVSCSTSSFFAETVSEHFIGDVGVTMTGASLALFLLYIKGAAKRNTPRRCADWCEFLGALVIFALISLVPSLETAPATNALQSSWFFTWITLLGYHLPVVILVAAISPYLGKRFFGRAPLLGWEYRAVFAACYISHALTTSFIVMPGFIQVPTSSIFWSIIANIATPVAADDRRGRRIRYRKRRMHVDI